MRCDVRVAVLLREPEPLREMRAHDVAVESTRGRAARARRHELATVVLPAAESPVNHRTKPLTTTHYNLLDIGGRDGVDAALDLVGAGPAARAPRAGLRRVGVADRVVALVVERVVREPAPRGCRPSIVVASSRRAGSPSRARAARPSRASALRARGRLVAADAGDPRVETAERRRRAARPCAIAR